jgi:hypothetical protein
LGDLGDLGDLGALGDFGTPAPEEALLCLLRGLLGRVGFAFLEELDEVLAFDPVLDRVCTVIVGLRLLLDDCGV